MNSGIASENQFQVNQVVTGANPGMTAGVQNRFKNQVPTNQEISLNDKEKDNAGELSEIFVSDPKRRRVGLVENKPDEEMCTSPETENKNKKTCFWRVLHCRPANPHEYSKLELPRYGAALENSVPSRRNSSREAYTGVFM